MEKPVDGSKHSQIKLDEKKKNKHTSFQHGGQLMSWPALMRMS